MVLHVDITNSVQASGWFTLATLSSAGIAKAPSRDTYFTLISRQTGDVRLALVNNIGQVQILDPTKSESSGWRGEVVWVVGQ